MLRFTQHDKYAGMGRRGGSGRFVILRCGLGFLFEDFAEVRWVFIAQPVRNFLDRQIGEGEQPSGLQQQPVLDEVLGGTAEKLAGNVGKLTWGDIELAGVIMNGVGLAVLLFQQQGKVMKELGFGGDGRFPRAHQFPLHFPQLD